MQCGYSTLSHRTHFRSVCVCVCVCVCNTQMPMLPKITLRRHKLASAFLSSSLISLQSGGWSGLQHSMLTTRATRKSGSNNRQVHEAHQLHGRAVAPVPSQQPHCPLREEVSGILVATLLHWPLLPPPVCTPVSLHKWRVTESKESLSPQ